jgi:hypothetical protein
MEEIAYENVLWWEEHGNMKRREFLNVGYMNIYTNSFVYTRSVRAHLPV